MLCYGFVEMCEVFWQYVNKVSNTVRERLRIGILVSGSVKARRDLRPPSCWKWWGWSPGGLSDLFKVTHRASKAQEVRPGSPGSQSCSLLGLQFCSWLYAFLCFSQNETQIVEIKESVVFGIWVILKVTHLPLVRGHSYLPPKIYLSIYS